jgi:hypothetical protein
VQQLLDGAAAEMTGGAGNDEHDSSREKGLTGVLRNRGQPAYCSDLETARPRGGRTPQRSLPSIIRSEYAVPSAPPPVPF